MPFVNVYTQFLSVHEHRACSVLFFVFKKWGKSSLNQISMF